MVCRAGPPPLGAGPRSRRSAALPASRPRCSVFVSEGPSQTGLRLLAVTPVSPGLASLTQGHVADLCHDSGSVSRACTACRTWWGCPWSLGTCGGAPGPVPGLTSLDCPPRPGGQRRVGLQAQPGHEQYLHRREAPARAHPSSTGWWTGPSQGTPGLVGRGPAASRASSQTAPCTQWAFRTVSQRCPVGTEDQMSVESDIMSIISSCPLAVSTLAFFPSKLDCIFEEGMMAVCTRGPKRSSVAMATPTSRQLGLSWRHAGWRPVGLHAALAQGSRGAMGSVRPSRCPSASVPAHPGTCHPSASQQVQPSASWETHPVL